MHPAQAIIDAIGTVLTAAIPSAHVFKHRTKTLSDDAGELPALLVTITDDTPLPAASTMTSLGSLLGVNVGIVDRDVDEETLMNRMLTLRRQVHAALMPLNALGLSYVLEVGYAGMADIQSDSNTEMVAKDMATRWQVAYRMNRDDPDV